jgi:flagellar basal-body rod protein FlgG
MIQAINTSATGLQTSQTLIDVTGNNLANLSTNAFKTGRPNFADLFSVTALTPGARTTQTSTSPTGLQVGLGTLTDSTQLLVTQGPLTNTGQNLDVAVEGNGFFQVLLPDGSTGYTRDGAFQLSPTGQLLSATGAPLLPPITVPPGSTVEIGPTGVVTAVFLNSSAPPVQIGQLTLARFSNAGGLDSQGSNLYKASPDSGPPLIGDPGQGGNGTLQQGFLEGSNVDSATQLTNLIIAQEAFNANREALTISNQMLEDTLLVFQNTTP